MPEITGAIATWKAAAALTAGTCVKAGANDDEVAQATDATAPVVGVVYRDDAAQGEPVAVQIAGVARVQAGGTVTRGNFVAPTTGGKVVNSATTAGLKYVLGVALQSAVNGEWVDVLLAQAPLNGATT